MNSDADFLARLEDRISQASPAIRADYSETLKAGIAQATRQAILNVAERHADIFSLGDREELSRVQNA